MATFEEAMRDTAKTADRAARRVISLYRRGDLPHEEDITGALIGVLATTLSGQVGGLNWSSKILKHKRGRSAEESVIGADLYIQVKLSTSTQNYKKGVLIQQSESIGTSY
jgi:hypothetical protein